MPGIVLCSRRWAFGSDDILIPALLLFICHFPSSIWLIVQMCKIDYNPNVSFSLKMYEYHIGYLIILLMILILELIALIISCRGTIMNTKPRKFLEQIIYSRLVLLLVELCFITAGIIILIKYKKNDMIEWYDKKMWNSIFSIVIGTSCFIIVLLLSINCVYDRAGKSFYKLQIFEKRYKNHPSSSTETARQLIHKRTLYLYQKNWRQRCTKLCCCIKKPKNQAAFSVISETLSYFFHKYDIVPSDILAGLLLLSQKQKLNRINVLTQVYLGIDDFVSGVPVTPVTKFIKLDNPEQLNEYEQLIYFFQFAMASYGWPLYAYNTRCACLKLFPNIRYCICSNKLFCCFSKKDKTEFCPLDDLHNIEIKDDNCCFCYFDGLLRQLPKHSHIINKKSNHKRNIEIIYVSFHSDIEKTPYFVAVDYLHKKIVITIRGTESLQDAITDMQYHQTPIPGTKWHAHKGMTNAACYIKNELESKKLLERAFNNDKELETDKFDILIVGHSLGGGTGAILSILLKPKYPNIKCFTYGPPGGLLSEECMLATKSFITTVIVGKDMVPRLGMFQMEKLRSDVMEVLQNSRLPKWQIISGLCCIRNRSNKSQNDQINDINDMLHSSSKNDDIDYTKNETVYLNSPISNETQESPSLYPPGRILHIVRKYPKNNNDNKINETINSKPSFQIIEADNHSFSELLISPRMLQDHMPQSVLNAMKAALKDQKNPEKSQNFIQISAINEQKNNTNCNLQPLSQINNKLIKIKNALFRQETKHNSNRQSKAISFCSYENTNFAPLAKQESFSDITNFDESLITNSLKNSILRLRDDDDDVKENDENEIVATSTPRNDFLTNKSSSSFTNQTNKTSTQDFNCTSLSMLNAQLNFNSSSIDIDKNFLIKPNDENSMNFTFSMSNDSKSNINNNNNTSNNTNLQNVSFLMDETDEYSSIEKLEILKPQSKDYILCFNTSIGSSIQSNNKIIYDDGIKTEQDFDSGIDIRHINSGSKQ